MSPGMSTRISAVRPPEDRVEERRDRKLREDARGDAEGRLAPEGGNRDDHRDREVTGPVLVDQRDRLLPPYPEEPGENITLFTILSTENIIFFACSN